MNTSLLHLRISASGDVLVYDNPLQEAYSLPGTLRIAFKHNPWLIHWNVIDTLNGLACLHWAQETDFGFEVMSVRKYVTVHAPPLLKGLKISRCDGEQALYLPINVFPDELTSARENSKQNGIHLATPWFLDKELREPTAGYDLVCEYSDKNTVEQTRPLPPPLRESVQDVLSWAANTPGFHGDFFL